MSNLYLEELIFQNWGPPSRRNSNVEIVRDILE